VKSRGGRGGGGWVKSRGGCLGGLPTVRSGGGGGRPRDALEGGKLEVDGIEGGGLSGGSWMSKGEKRGEPCGTLKS